MIAANIAEVPELLRDASPSSAVSEGEAREE
jgi:hypothetical protein